MKSFPGFCPCCNIVRTSSRDIADGVWFCAIGYLTSQGESGSIGSDGQLMAMLWVYRYMKNGSRLAREKIGERSQGERSREEWSSGERSHNMDQSDV